MARSRRTPAMFSWHGALRSFPAYRLQGKVKKSQPPSAADLSLRAAEDILQFLRVPIAK